jgi:predicted esterase
MDETGIETDLSITAEIKLYYDVYVPPGIPRDAPLLIAVHGYGAHKRYMMREARLIANERFVIASIQAPHQHYRQADDGSYRVGFGWLTDHRSDESVALHHRFVLDVIDALAGRAIINERNVFLFGFSQACALNFRFAFTHPGALAGLVAVCGGVPGDLDENKNYRPFEGETFYLYGDDDEWYSEEKFAEFDGKLLARLPNYRSKRYHAKHEITPEMRADIAEFLRESVV